MFPDQIAHSFLLSLFFLWFQAKIDSVFPSVLVLLKCAMCSQAAAMSLAASNRLQIEACTKAQPVMLLGLAKLTL